MTHGLVILLLSIFFTYFTVFYIKFGVLRVIWVERGDAISAQYYEIRKSETQKSNCYNIFPVESDYVMAPYTVTLTLTSFIYTTSVIYLPTSSFFLTDPTSSYLQILYVNRNELGQLTNLSF